MYISLFRRDLIYSRFLSSKANLTGLLNNGRPSLQRTINLRSCSSIICSNQDLSFRNRKGIRSYSSPNAVQINKFFNTGWGHTIPSAYFPIGSSMHLNRFFHTSNIIFEKEKTKVEQTVDALKESIKSKEAAVEPGKVTAVAPVKRSIGQRVLAEIKHYYHGFRLLFIDVYISAKLLLSIAKGNSLSRREHRLLIRTVSDIFRLVPFSVFIIVPFMELLLPVFIKLFPNMLPSTFQSTDEREAKMKKSLKVKLEMAKFLQDTLDVMAVKSKGDSRSDTAREFSTFFEKVRVTGAQATNEEILRFSKFFEDELTLDSLNRQQLMALCRLLELQSFGTTNFLRFQLRMRLRNLIADDKTIMNEGVQQLDYQELQAACKARGMRAYGMPEERMRSQLDQWLELSQNEKIPPSLLLLSRALYIPENLPATDQLKVTLSALPEAVTTQTKAKIGEVEGKVDNKTKIEIIREEQKQIEIEKIEELQLKAEASSDLLIDKAPILQDNAPECNTDATKAQFDVNVKESDSELSSTDLDVIEDALENISAEKKKLMLEKEELQDLKEEMAEYKEDMEELKDVVVLSGLTNKELRPNKASERLFKQVDRMINKMDSVVRKLEDQGKALQQNGDETIVEKVNIEELIQAIQKLQKTPDSAKLKKIAIVLKKMDDDRDGAIKVDDVLQVIELIGQEDVKLTSQQVNEIVQLLDKEENLENVERVEKDMEREEQHKKAEAVKNVEK